jgi:hypothetical protein
MMLSYAFSTAAQETLLLHASVVRYQGKAYAFTAPSGTGKSTQVANWLSAIDGCDLINDDNPIIRMMPDGKPMLYGSPWSGKTPCYRNVSYPLGAIVELSQAPENIIRRLRPLQAYAALMNSISGKRWDSRIAEGLHATENQIITNAAMWHLDCLPDEAAARLCEKSVCHDE